MAGLRSKTTLKAEVETGQSDGCFLIAKSNTSVFRRLLDFFNFDYKCLTEHILVKDKTLILVLLCESEDSAFPREDCF